MCIRTAFVKDRHELVIKIISLFASQAMCTVAIAKKQNRSLCSEKKIKISGSTRSRTVQMQKLHMQPASSADYISTAAPITPAPIAARTSMPTPLWDAMPLCSFGFPVLVELPLAPAPSVGLARVVGAETKDVKVR